MTVIRLLYNEKFYAAVAAATGSKNMFKLHLFYFLASEMINGKHTVEVLQPGYEKESRRLQEERFFWFSQRVFFF